MTTINTSTFAGLKAELRDRLIDSFSSGEHEICDHADLIHEHVEACLSTYYVDIYSCLFDREFDCVLEYTPEHTLHLNDIILVAIGEQLSDYAYECWDSLIEDYENLQDEE